MLPASLRTLSLDVPPHVLALPRPLTLAVFALLPVDARLRCCAVNRAWRALLASPTFWACVDLSISSGCVRFSVPLLRAAVAKAGGQLRALIITGRRLLELERPITTVTTSTRPSADDAMRMELLMKMGHVWSDADVRLMLHSHPYTVSCLKWSRPTRPRSWSCVRTRVQIGIFMPCECYLRLLPRYKFLKLQWPSPTETAKLRVQCCATSHRSRLFDCGDCCLEASRLITRRYSFVRTYAVTRRSRSWSFTV